MRLLLDTHILLAFIENRTHLLPRGIRRSLDPSWGAGEFFVSVASLWEIAINWRLGKLQPAPRLDALPEFTRRHGYRDPRDRCATHVLAAVEPEPSTRDPFDRLLLAQCQVEDLRLVTIDRSLISHRLSVPSDR